MKPIKKLFTRQKDGQTQEKHPEIAISTPYYRFTSTKGSCILTGREGFAQHYVPSSRPNKSENTFRHSHDVSLLKKTSGDTTKARTQPPNPPLTTFQSSTNPPRSPELQKRYHVRHSGFEIPRATSIPSRSRLPVVEGLKANSGIAASRTNAQKDRDNPRALLPDNELFQNERMEKRGRERTLDALLMPRWTPGWATGSVSSRSTMQLAMSAGSVQVHPAHDHRERPLRDHGIEHTLTPLEGCLRRHRPRASTSVNHISLEGSVQEQRNSLNVAARSRTRPSLPPIDTSVGHWRHDPSKNSVSVHDTSPKVSTERHGYSHNLLRRRQRLERCYSPAQPSPLKARERPSSTPIVLSQRCQSSPRSCTSSPAPAFVLPVGAHTPSIFAWQPSYAQILYDSIVRELRCTAKRALPWRRVYKRPAALFADAAPPTRYCIGCADDLDEALFPLGALSPTCQHDVNTCWSCMNEWITMQIKTSAFGFDIRCAQCGAALSYEAIREAVSKDVFEL